MQKNDYTFRLGLGGIIGSGNQAFSYIHIDDLLRAYKFVIENNLEDTFNLICTKTYYKPSIYTCIRLCIKRPTLIPVPEFVLKLIFSEGAKVLTDGQDVIPKNYFHWDLSLNIMILRKL